MARGIATRALAGGHTVTLLGTEPARPRRSRASCPATCAPAPSATRSPATSSCSPSGTRRSTTSSAATATSSTGKVVVDITNPVDPQTYAPLTVEAGSAAQEIAQKAPGAKVVKAFNTTFAGSLVEGQVGGQPLDVFVASDDDDAKATRPRARRERRPARPRRRPARPRPPARRRRLPAHGDPARPRRHLRQRPEGSCPNPPAPDNATVHQKRPDVARSDSARHLAPPWISEAGSKRSG